MGPVGPIAVELEHATGRKTWVFVRFWLYLGPEASYEDGDGLNRFSVEKYMKHDTPHVEEISPYIPPETTYLMAKENAYARMAPWVHPLRIVRMLLMGAGLTPPSSGLTHRLMVTWNCIMFILIGLLICNNILGFAYLGDEDLALLLENVALLLTSTMVFSRFLIMTLKKKQLYIHLARIENLMEEIEKVNGSETFIKVKKETNLVAAAYIIICLAFHVPTYAHTYYKYYYEGVEDAIPFGIFMPFDKKNNIHASVWYQVFLFYGSVYCVNLTNVLILTVGLVTASLIAKIGDRYESLDLLRQQSSLKQTIQWHSEIIKIVEETNSLFGIAFVFDYILSCVYISIAGYLLVKIGLHDQSTLPKYLVLYYAFVVNPSFFCFGGHLISSENDRLVRTIFSNNWYQTCARDKKILILPAMMAGKRLCWNYKGFFYFDMDTYYQIVMQSYSFITMLRLLE